MSAPGASPERPAFVFVNALIQSHDRKARPVNWGNDLLPGRLPAQVWRVAAYPFVGIFVAEALIPRIFPSDPTFGGIHLVTALVGLIVAVIVDWIITEARHPAWITTPERGLQPQPV